MSRHTVPIAADRKKPPAALSAALQMVFVMSFAGSLTKWRREGILSREIRILHEYLATGVFARIHVFSYSRADLALLDEMAKSDPVLKGLRVLAPPVILASGGKIGLLLYSLFGPLIHRKAIAGANLIRTNQISGSWSALLAKLFTGTPLILRLGYLLSRRHSLNGKTFFALIADMIERMGFRFADAVIVTSELARDEIGLRSGHPEKVHLIPTYVDPEVFVPKRKYDFDAPLLYVGRLTAQKNLHALITACAEIGRQLHIVGAGEQRAGLEDFAQKSGAQVTFLGTMSNTDLATRIQEYTIFVLPSLHEGLPKVLIEAMASGLVCVGTNVPGTSDLIEDGATGYLAKDVSATEIARALSRAIDEKRSELGAAARKAIQRKFSIKVYAASEAALIGKIAK